MQYFFGAGSLYGRQTFTGAGASVSNPTPIRFGAVQDVGIDISFDTKELFGQYQFPLYTARGNGKITGKATFAQLFGAAFNNIFFGESSIGTTPTFTAIDEIQTVSANTATVSNNTTYVQDLGVLNTATGINMTRVSSGPSGTGNYSVNESTGVYTFNSAMNNVAVAISYDYTSAGNGTLVTGANQLTGSSPQFLMVLSGSLGGKSMRLKLNACMASKLSMGTKLSDYTMPAFDFSAFSDVSGNWGSFSFSE